METTIIVTLITVSGSIIIASLSFYLTKRHEIKMQWRKEKILHYKTLLEALSELAIDDTDKDKANIKFAMSVNTIALVAPQLVVTSLMAYHDEVKFSNKNRSPEKHDRLLMNLLLAIRKDLSLSKKDNPETFNFHLIGSKPKK